jgi:hypothetical protein
MTKRIIYPTDDGGVAVIIPAPECGLTIEEIAAKDVPPVVRYEGTGVFEKDEDTGEMHETQQEIQELRPYKIVDVADIPSDRTFRNAWEYTE